MTDKPKKTRKKRVFKEQKPIPIGKVFGKLTSIGRCGVNKHHQVIYKCLCSCGKEHLVPKYQLLNGRVKSCGSTECMAKKNTIFINDKSLMDLSKEYHIPYSRLFQRFRRGLPFSKIIQTGFLSNRTKQLGGYSQVELAKKLNVSRQRINQRLQRGDIYDSKMDIWLIRGASPKPKSGRFIAPINKSSGITEAIEVTDDRNND